MKVNLILAGISGAAGGALLGASTSDQPETWLGLASAALALITALYRRQAQREERIDNRLRKLEQGMTRIETHLGIDERVSSVLVTERPPPENEMP